MEIDRVKWKGGQKGDGKEEVKTFIKERKKERVMARRASRRANMEVKKQNYFTSSDPHHDILRQPGQILCQPDRVR